MCRLGFSASSSACFFSPISLPSLGVRGVRPLLEPPVELAGLLRRIANGFSGAGEGTGCLFICAESGTPVIIVELRCRTPAPGRPTLSLPWADDAAEAVARAVIPLSELVLCLDACVGIAIDSLPEGFRDPNELLEADEVCNVVLRGRWSNPEARLLLFASFCLPNGGRDVTLKEGGGERCLIGIGAMRSLLATGADGSCSSSLPLLLLLDPVVCVGRGALSLDKN